MGMLALFGVVGFIVCVALFVFSLTKFLASALVGKIVWGLLCVAFMYVAFFALMTAIQVLNPSLYGSWRRFIMAHETKNIPSMTISEQLRGEKLESVQPIIFKDSADLWKNRQSSEGVQPKSSILTIKRTDEDPVYVGMKLLDDEYARDGFVIYDTKNKRYLGFLNNPEMKADKIMSFGIWELAKGATGWEVVSAIESPTIARIQESLSLARVDSVIQIVRNRLILRISENDMRGMQSMTLGIYDLETDIYAKLGEPSWGNFNIVDGPHNAKVLIYGSDELPIQYGLYKDTFTHFTLFSESHPEGLKFMTLKFDLGKVIAAEFVDDTFHVKTVLDNAQREEKYWAINLEQIF